MPRLCLSVYSIVCLCSLLAGNLQGQTVGALFESGPRDNRINLVVLSEGYTASELGAFPAQAQKLVDHLFSEDPFLAYKNLFNAYSISVASEESGADIPSEDIDVDTAFDATFGSSGIERLLTIINSKVSTVLLNHLPEYDIVLVLVNSTKYGGSGGNFAVTSLASSAVEIAAHEIGHSFGGLADEYELAGGSPRERPNATAETDRAKIRWNSWIEDETPVPTPEGSEWRDVIGLFETQIAWSLNGVQLPESSTSYNLEANSLPPGNSQLTVRVYESTGFVRNDPSDLLAEERTWTITAPPVESRDTVFINWLHARLQEFPKQVSPTDDPDRDGRSNLLEFFFDSNPANPDLDSIKHGIDEGLLFMEIARELKTIQATATVEASQDLATWTPLAVSENGQAFAPAEPSLPEPIDRGEDRQRVYDSEQIDSAAKRTMRIKIEITTP